MSTISASDILCARIAQRLSQSVGTKRYNMWFDRSAKFEYVEADRRLQVSVPNRFVGDWIDRHFETELRSAADAELGHEVKLELLVRPERFANVAQQSASSTDAPTKPKRRAALPTNLKHRLEDFVVGLSNQLAYAAAQRILSDEGSKMSPLFLHGGCGQGKTHLLQGICREMMRQRPDAAVQYLTGEQFTNEFVDAVRSGDPSAFRRRIRRLDLLAVDDVRFIAGKKATQQEFLHSFDSIELGGAKVVLASDCHPRLIKQFSEALVSRCIRGMVVQIEPPDAETRLRIVRALSQRRGLSMGDSVARYIADRCTESVRQIEGTLTKVHALASLTTDQGSAQGGIIEVGHALVDHLFSDDLASLPRRAVRLDSILHAVCAEMAVKKEQILGSGRHRHVVVARSVLMYLARQMTSMSYPEIATAMGRSNHSTIVTACRRLEKQIADGLLVSLGHQGEQVTLAVLLDRLKYTVARASGE